MLLALCNVAIAQSPAAIGYHVQLSDAHAHTLRVRVDLPPGAAQQEVQLPVWNALYQIRDFAQNVRGFHAHDAGGRSLPVEALDKTTWRIGNAEQGAELEYEIHANLGGPYGAQFNQEHAFLNLGELLIYAIAARGQPVTLELENVPKGWQIATALARNQQTAQSATFFADSYDQLVDAPIELGTFHQTSFVQDGANYQIVVDAAPGDYQMSSLSSLVGKIAAAEVSWMQDRPFASYLFIYHFPRQASGGGMEHANSCAIELDAGQLASDPLDLESVTAHEFFHLWNVKRIRPASLEPIDYAHENYTRALWFSEGVTTTVAEIALRRAGLLSEQQFLQSLAREIRTLQLRPAHTWQSAEESSLDTWLERYPEYGSPERSISYYNKGDLLGVLLDLEMRRVTHGKKCLRDLFQWMNQQYAMHHQYFPDSAGVRAAAEAVTGADFSEFFDSYVSGVQELPYQQLLATVGLRLLRHEVEIPDIGFDSVRNEGERPIVVAVVEGSDAAKAGISPGDTILKLNGKPAQQEIGVLLASLHPGEVVRLQVAGLKGTHELKLKLGVRQEEQVEIADLETITSEQRARRGAWLVGEAEK